MALKNKDGTIYKLSSPNPAMSEQAFWNDKEKLILHNKIGRTVIYDRNLIPVDKQVDEMVIPDFTQKEEEVIIVPALEPAKLVGEFVEKITVWCLPAQVEEKIDPLYGDKYKRIIYGEKFLFEAAMADQSDFFLCLISSVEILPNSIIYPRNYDKRWWKVINVSKINDLYKLHAEMTDYQPRFN